MKNEKLFFYIKKFIDGSYRVETPDIRYHWREGLLKYNVKQENLGLVLENIAETLRNEYNIDVLFEFENI